MIPGIRRDTREVAANDGASVDSGSRSKLGVIECRLGMQQTGAPKRDRAIRAIKVPPRSPFGGGLLTVTNDPPDPPPPDDPPDPWNPPDGDPPVVVADPPPFNPVRIPVLAPGVSGVCEVQELTYSPSGLSAGKSGYRGLFTVAWKDLTPKEFRLFQVGGRRATPLMLLPYSPKDMAFSIPLGDPAAMQCDDYGKNFGPIFRLMQETQLSADMVDTSDRKWPLLVSLIKLNTITNPGRLQPEAGETFSYQFISTDPNAVWSATNLPAGFTLSPSGLLTGVSNGSNTSTTIYVSAQSVVGDANIDVILEQLSANYVTGGKQWGNGGPDGGIGAKGFGYDATGNITPPPSGIALAYGSLQVKNNTGASITVRPRFAHFPYGGGGACTIRFRLSHDSDMLQEIDIQYTGSTDEFGVTFAPAVCHNGHSLKCLTWRVTPGPDDNSWVGGYRTVELL